MNGHDLMALGIRGKAIGDALEWLLEKVLEEERKLDVEALIAEALEGVEKITLG